MRNMAGPYYGEMSDFLLCPHWVPPTPTLNKRFARSDIGEKSIWLGGYLSTQMRRAILLVTKPDTAESVDKTQCEIT